jgi:hypothetical protein
MNGKRLLWHSSATLVALTLGLSLAACGDKPAPAPSANKAPEPTAKASSEKAAGRAAKRGAGRRGDSTAALGLKVKLELLQKLGVDGLRVDVEAQGGSVVLAGEVKKRETSELASEVARQVKGVTSVENKIRLAGNGGATADKALAEAEHELADAALETRARMRLVDRLGSDGFRIGTDAASGVLTLEFPKEMPAPRRKEAVKVAKRVEGVKKVVSLEKK